MVSKYGQSGRTAKGSTRTGFIGKETNFYVDGQFSTGAKLQLIMGRLDDLQPVLNAVEELFSVMESERFANGGPAPDFGISDEWAPPKSHPYIDYKNGDQTLINFGYLSDAAIAPTWQSIGLKAVRAVIDPRKQPGALETYGAKVPNYGYEQQMGFTKDGVQRQFVEITQEFATEAMALLEAYIGIGAVDKNGKLGNIERDEKRLHKELRKRREHHKEEGRKHRDNKSRDENLRPAQAEKRGHGTEEFGSAIQEHIDYAKHASMLYGESEVAHLGRAQSAESVMARLQKEKLITNGKVDTNQMAKINAIITYESKGYFSDLKSFGTHAKRFNEFKAKYSQKSADGMMGE